jgi:hypothetical protein
LQANGLLHEKTSSAWIKTQGEQYGSFYWQGGYGDFSIGWSQLEELTPSGWLAGGWRDEG